MFDFCLNENNYKDILQCGKQIYEVDGYVINKLIFVYFELR